MKHKMIAIIVLALTCTGFAQFNYTVADSIAASGTTSAGVDTKGQKVAAVIFPATFQGSTVTFKTSDDNSTFYTVQYNGADVSLTASDGKQCGLKPVEANQFLRYVKAVSDSTETTLRQIKFVITNF